MSATSILIIMMILVIITLIGGYKVMQYQQMVYHCAEYKSNIVEYYSYQTGGYYKDGQLIPVTTHPPHTVNETNCIKIEMIKTK